MAEKKKTIQETNSRFEFFPRTNKTPNQSPKYWAKEKDRYLRQLLIADIVEITGRSLIVYFSQLDQEINHSDPDDLAEILSGTDSKSVDIFIQTPGGSVDATEKIVSLLQNSTDDYRVIVPSWAKSAGTVIALSSSKILLGMNSELGPIDPQLPIQGTNIPCEIVATAPNIPEHIQQLAANFSKRMKNMATSILTTGMMKGKSKKEIDEVVEKISSTNGYLSHGAVIDHTEAESLGLSYEYIEPTEDLWKKIWLLYCMYDYDSKQKNLGKIFEGQKFSISRPK